MPIDGSRPARPVGWRASAPRSSATSPISSGSACRRTSWRARIRRASARRYALREGLALLGGLPLAAWGLASHALPYWLTRVARAVAPDLGRRHGHDQAGRGRLFSIPACWALEAWASSGVLGGWGLDRVPRRPDPDGAVRARLANPPGARPPRRSSVRPVPVASRPARAARGPAPGAGRGDRGAGPARAARGADGRGRRELRARRRGRLTRHAGQRPDSRSSSSSGFMSNGCGPRTMKCCTPACSSSSICP